MKYKVLVTCPPMLRGIDAVRDTAAEMSMELTTPNVLQTLTEDELIDQLQGHDGWIIGDDPATARVVAAAKDSGLKAAVKWGIGVDNVDLTAFKEAEIPIVNTPNMFGDEVADLAMCYLIGLARHAFRIDREVREGSWPKPAGMSLRGKTVGIVGLGDIGSQFAARAKASGLQILAWDPNVQRITPDVKLMSEWPTGLSQCDFLVLTCSLNGSTMHLFDDRVAHQIKAGLKLINVSRGPLVDEVFLLGALKSGLVASAALDVFECEPLPEASLLKNFPSCVFGSHNASNTTDAVQKASIQALGILHERLVTS